MELLEILRLGDMELIASWFPHGVAPKTKEGAARRDEQISELLSQVQDDPARVYALLQLQDYGVPDQNDFYFEVRTLLAEALEQIDQSGEYLVMAALLPDTAWYSRRQVVYMLKARRNKALFAQLLPMLEESGLQGEIRATVATGLGQHQVEEARPVLRSLYKALRKPEDHRLAGWTYAEADMLEALGSLGERETLRPLIALQYHPYQSRRLSGQRGLNQLIKHLGGLKEAVNLLDKKPEDAIAAQLARLAASDQQETVRRWAIEQLVETGDPQTVAVLCDRLSDSSWMVANAAARKLTELPEAPLAHLKGMVENSITNTSARLWAAYVLLKRSQPVPQELLNSIPDYPYSLPPFISTEIRRAIVSCWAESSEPGTDVRWLVEGQTLPAFQAYEPPFERLKAELQRRSLNTTAPRYCGELYKQGRGTFWVLQSRTAYEGKLYFYTLYLTMLGPFANLNVLVSEDDTANSAEIPFNDLTPDETRRAYREAAGAAGLTMLDTQVTSYVFPGLNVYFFGNREPLPVNDLLYYWQD